MSNFVTLKELQVGDEICLDNGRKCVILEMGEMIKVGLRDIHANQSKRLLPSTQVKLLSHPVPSAIFVQRMSQC